MSNKKITLGLAVGIAVLLSLFFFTQNYLYDGGNKLENTLNSLLQSVKQDDWNKAETSFHEFNTKWKSGRFLIALNNAEQDFTDMSDAIENLKGAIEIKDKYKTLQLTNQLIGHWKNFKKLVPEP